MLLQRLNFLTCLLAGLPWPERLRLPRTLGGRAPHGSKRKGKFGGKLSFFFCYFDSCLVHPCLGKNERPHGTALSACDSFPGSNQQLNYSYTMVVTTASHNFGANIACWQQKGSKNEWNLSFWWLLGGDLIEVNSSSPAEEHRRADATVCYQDFLRTVSLEKHPLL